MSLRLMLLWSALLPIAAVGLSGCDEGEEEEPSVSRSELRETQRPSRSRPTVVRSVKINLPKQAKPAELKLSHASVVVRNDETVIFLRTYRSAATETFPSLMIHAVQPHRPDQLAGRRILAMAFFKAHREGDTWESPEPIELLITLIDEEQIIGEIVRGTLFDGVQPIEISGSFHAQRLPDE